VLAAGIYIVISVGSIHKLAYGFAADFPWSAVYWGVLLVSVFFSDRASLLDGLRRYAKFLPLLVMVAISSLLHIEQPWTVDRFLYFLKIQAALVLILAVIRSRQDLLWILAALVASISFHAAKGARLVLTEFTSKGISGPPDSMIGDNNHYATALVMCLPLLAFFAITVRQKWAMVGIWTVFVACLMVVLGTWSRGGLVALTAVGLLATLMLKTHRWRVLAIALPAAALIWGALPDQFHERVDTIADYQDDASVQGRFQAWKTATSLANSEPFGGGFDHYLDPSRWAHHAPEGSRPRAAHSIYFQMLGDHGYPGLIALLWLLLWALKAAWSGPLTVAEIQGKPPLSHYVMLSLSGILVGGAFLSLAYWEGFYMLLGCMFCLDAPEFAPAFAGQSESSSTGRVSLKT
jgi:probable O-glycosylation ligase (exosortase A-associated)